MLGIDLRERVALVTGGTRGVGRATARLLADAGADVAIGYRTRADQAAEVLAELRQRGVRAVAEAGDLVEPEAGERLVERAVRDLGGLDIVVASAGIWPSEDAPVEALDLERWRLVLSVNLDAVFHLLRAAVPRLRDDGRIVVVGSTAGQRGEAFHAEYAASKGALQSLVKGVALELAPRGITVNCVAPGWIDTDMCEAPFAGDGRARIEATIPLGRVAPAADVAGPIVFLCSTLGRHITGEVLNVNGGAVLCG